MRVKNNAVVDDGFLAITGLSRAMCAGVALPDVGSLLWVILRQIVPCDGMALFFLDRAGTHVVVGFAAGAHTRGLEGLRRPAGSGIAGWVAMNRRSVLNAEPVFDIGRVSPALRSSVLVPLVDNGAIVAVLALYSKDLLAFTDEHVSLLELLGPRLALAVPLEDSETAAEVAFPAETRPALRLVSRQPEPECGTRLQALPAPGEVCDREA